MRSVIWEINNHLKSPHSAISGLWSHSHLGDLPSSQVSPQRYIRVRVTQLSGRCTIISSLPTVYISVRVMRSVIWEIYHHLKSPHSAISGLGSHSYLGDVPSSQVSPQSISVLGSWGQSSGRSTIISSLPTALYQVMVMRSVIWEIYHHLKSPHSAISRLGSHSYLGDLAWLRVSQQRFVLP